MSTLDSTPPITTQAIHLSTDQANQLEARLILQGWHFWPPGRFWFSYTPLATIRRLDFGRWRCYYSDRADAGQLLEHLGAEVAR